MTTAETVRPIIHQAYGHGAMAEALVECLAAKIDAGDFGHSTREGMIMHVCWDWMTGGSTAAAVAAKIEAALTIAGEAS